MIILGKERSMSSIKICFMKILLKYFFMILIYFLKVFKDKSICLISHNLNMTKNNPTENGKASIPQLIYWDYFLIFLTIFDRNFISNSGK